MSLRQFSTALALIITGLCGVTFAQTIPSGPSQSGTVQTVSADSPNHPDTPALQQRHPRYQVKPSDVLAVTFPLSPELNIASVTVQPDGYITLPNVGSIYVRGDTVPQIVDTLIQAYATTLHNPIINVDITNFQVPEFTVNGQVGRPGQYPLRIETTVSEGVAVAGGFLPTAKTQVFLFHRVLPDLVEVKKLNLKEILHGKSVNEDVHLQPGDMIFVPDKFIASFRKYVPYSFGLGSGLSFNGTTLLTQ
jgi:polysaccharide biosynthesis/export protein